MSPCLLASLAFAALLAPWSVQTQRSVPSTEGAGSSSGRPPATEPRGAAASPVAEATPSVGGAGPAADLLPLTDIAPLSSTSAPLAEVAGSSRASCWVQESTDFNGADLPSPAAVAGSAADCCAACWDTTGCGAWTFRASDVSCSGAAGHVCMAFGHCRA